MGTAVQCGVTPKRNQKPKPFPPSGTPLQEGRLELAGALSLTLRMCNRSEPQLITLRFREHNPCLSGGVPGAQEAYMC